MNGKKIILQLVVKRLRKKTTFRQKANYKEEQVTTKGTHERKTYKSNHKIY